MLTHFSAGRMFLSRLVTSASEEVIYKAEACANLPFLDINIRRSHLVEDSLKNFRFLLDDEKKRNIKIDFVGEDGMDGGILEIS